jgi:hypothetical protein
MITSVLKVYSVNDTTINECAAVHGMRTSRENQSAQRKPVPVPLCPPQIPHDLTWDQTQAAMVGAYYDTEY